MENINENLIECAKKFVKELMKNNDPSHDWHHVERVFKNANYILSLDFLCWHNYCFKHLNFSSIWLDCAF